MYSGAELLAQVQELRRLIVEEEKPDGVPGGEGGLVVLHDDIDEIVADSGVHLEDDVDVCTPPGIGGHERR